MLALSLPLLCGGCVVATVATAIVVLPVKAVGAGINAVVETQDEKDAKRGRAERKAEEKARKAEAKAAKEPK